MIRDIDISTLRSFIAVAEHSNVTFAATQRALTQSAVSQQIKRLEQTFNRVLFIRSKAGVMLSDAGNQLLPLARRSVAANDEMLTLMGKVAIGAEIRLGVAHDLVSGLLPEPLSEFHRESLHTNVVLVSAPSAVLAAMLQSGDVDLAITTDTEEIAEATRLFKKRLSWVGAKNGQAKSVRPLPIAVSTQECPFRMAIASTLSDKKIPWKPMTQRGSLEAMAAILKADMAVSALLPQTLPPDIYVQDDPNLPELPEFLIHIRLPDRELSAQESKLTAFIEKHLSVIV